MTTITTPTCPTCGGEQLPGHPAGVLTFDHRAECELRSRLDGRVMADADAFREDQLLGVLRRRSSPEEWTLIDAAGLIDTEVDPARVFIAAEPVAGLAIIRRDVLVAPTRITEPEERAA